MHDDADAVAAIVTAAGQSGRYALASCGHPPWRAIWQIPADDHDGVAEALLSRLRDEGYDAQVTHWGVIRPVP